MRRVEQVRTRHQQLEVWKSARVTEFRVEGAVHAWHHRDRLLTGLAWDLIAAASLLGKPQPRSILMLGLAGGTAFRILRHLLPDCRLTAIDIDPEIVELARSHMDLDALGIEVIIGDGYEWLRRNRRHFDVVIDDVYLAGRSDVFRPHSLADGALLAQLRQAISPQGVLAVNLVTGAGHRRMQSATRRALLNNFPLVRSVRSPHALNEVLVAGEQVTGIRRLDATAFTDWRDRDLWACLSQRLLKA